MSCQYRCENLSMALVQFGILLRCVPCLAYNEVPTCTNFILYQTDLRIAVFRLQIYIYFLAFRVSVTLPPVAAVGPTDTIFGMMIYCTYFCWQVHPNGSDRCPWAAMSIVFSSWCQGNDKHLQAYYSITWLSCKSSGYSNTGLYEKKIHFPSAKQGIRMRYELRIESKLDENFFYVRIEPLIQPPDFTNHHQGTPFKFVGTWTSDGTL